jgi:hypothetical protein
MSQSEEKVIAKRNYRIQEQVNKEKEIEESLIRAQGERIFKQQARDQEEKLATELERFKIEQLRDAKMRQQLRETRYFRFIAIYTVKTFMLWIINKIATNSEN